MGRPPQEVESRTSVRVRKDAFGEVKVPTGVFYDKETTRWIEKFGVGDPLPFSFISALALVKKSLRFCQS